MGWGCSKTCWMWLKITYKICRRGKAPTSLDASISLSSTPPSSNLEADRWCLLVTTAYIHFIPTKKHLTSAFSSIVGRSGSMSQPGCRWGGSVDQCLCVSSIALRNLVFSSAALPTRMWSPHSECVRLMITFSHCRRSKSSTLLIVANAGYVIPISVAIAVYRGVCKSLWLCRRWTGCGQTTTV